MTFTLTRPDSSQLLLTRSTNTSIPANGLLTQTQVKNSTGAVLSKSDYTYANDDGSSPQVQSMTSYDDLNTPTKVDFDYDQYGNITNRREYAFKISGAWQVRRRTHTTYKTDSAYISAYLRGLVVEVKTLDAHENTSDGDDTPVARSTYTYDDYNAMGGMEQYTGQPTPPGYIAVGTIRGNVTGTTQWTDLREDISITRLKKYDKFGNVIKEQVACCEEKSYTNTEIVWWAAPEKIKRGVSSGVYLETATEFDYNTTMVKLQKDPNNLQTTHSYDAAMRRTGTITPTGMTTSTSHNDGQLSSSSSVTYDDGGTNKTVNQSEEKDGWGRVIRSFNAHGGQVNTVYDSMGRVASKTNPFAAGGQPGPATTNLYDALGRTKEVTLPDGDKITTTYEGNKTTVTDPVGRKMKRETDGLGRLVKVTEQDGSGQLTQDTNYSYDLLDNLVQVNQGGQLRSYKYDALERLLYEKTPEKDDTIIEEEKWTMKYVYNADNQVVIKTDPRGVETHYKYDELNRLIERWYTGLGGDEEGTDRPALPSTVGATPTVHYNYDNNQASATTGLLLSVQLVPAAGGSVIYQESYSYDSNNRVQSRNWTRDGKSYTVSYQYNAASQRKKLTYPSTREIDLSYDNQGRSSSVGGYVSGVGYNVAGQETGWTLGNGTVETLTYGNSRLQMTSLTAVKGGNTMMSLNYDYQAQAGQSGAGTTAGNSGQLMAINNNSTIGGAAESAGYTYDLLGRLVTSNQTTNGVSTQRRFAYDRWGNRTGVWDAVSGGNQIQTVTLEQGNNNRIQSVTTSGVTKNYVYDEAGNVTDDGTHTYIYNAENLLVTMDWGQANGHAYAFDEQNRRIKKFSSATGWTHYVWEGSQVIAEYSHTGALNVEYISAGSKMVATVAGTVTRYYVSDRLSTRLTLDANGNIVGRQGHLPFGEESGTSGEQEKHRFTSYERDSESGLDYAVNRQYASLTGRFLSVDPLENKNRTSQGGGCSGSGNNKTHAQRLNNPQSWDGYTYGFGDPVNRVDPNGLWPCGTQFISDHFHDPLAEFLACNPIVLIPAPLLFEDDPRIATITYKWRRSYRDKEGRLYCVYESCPGENQICGVLFTDRSGSSTCSPGVKVTFEIRKRFFWESCTPINHLHLDSWPCQ
jgi:RHS repeat-associated protein